MYFTNKKKFSKILLNLKKNAKKLKFKRLLLI